MKEERKMIARGKIVKRKKDRKGLELIKMRVEWRKNSQREKKEKCGM